MAFPIKPKRRSGAVGNPTSLELGELAVNTADGSLYLGGDSAVMLINSPLAAGTTVTQATGDGSTTAFAINGFTTTDLGAYLVTVGGIEQRPTTDFTVSGTAGGTVTFATAPRSGEAIIVRAIQAGGGGGSGNATQIQGRDVASTAPTDGQVLAWNNTASRWEPTSINGSITFNTAGTHEWVVPAWLRWVYVSGAAGDGTAGTDGTNGQPGENGAEAYQNGDGNWIAPTTGANGADGTDGVDGQNGGNVTISALSINLIGGTGGVGGLKGYGGGGSGGNGNSGNAEPPTQLFDGAPGASGNGPYAGGGGGGAGATYEGTGGLAGGGNAGNGSQGGGGGIGDEGGGNGGDGKFGTDGAGFNLCGGGGGGGYLRSGGGGGGGGNTTGFYFYGQPGNGGTGTPGTAGGAGDTIAQAMDLSAVAGTTIQIVISAGAGSPTITFTY
mgnify:CR=1 FL=1